MLQWRMLLDVAGAGAEGGKLLIPDRASPAEYRCSLLHAVLHQSWRIMQSWSFGPFICRSVLRACTHSQIH